MEKIISKSELQTKKFGERIAKEILNYKPQKSAAILGLQGDLGSGKTTLLQGLAKELGIKEKITSPTFVIMKRFLITIKKPQKINILRKSRSRDLWYKWFYHIDCYRLNKPWEILSLGFKEIILNPQNIIAIEWPEKIYKVLPKEIILIKFNHLEENKRKTCQII